jgi:hypothetical protein
MDANSRKPGAGGGPGTRNAHGVAAEPDRVPTKIALSLFGVLIMAAVAAALIVFVLFRAFEGGAEKKDRAAIAEAGLERLQDAVPPPPRLQIHGVASWNAFRDAETERLSSYGWMDRSAGAVHVPVDRAMELVLQRGVGPLPPGAMAVPSAPVPAAPAEGKQ